MSMMRITPLSGSLCWTLAAVFNLVLALLLTSVTPAVAQPDDNRADGAEARSAAPWRSGSVNEQTVGLVFSAEQQFQSPGVALGDLLADDAGLRLVNIMGRNHVLNLYDLLYLNGIDTTLVRADAIEFVKRSNEFPGISRVVNVLASVGQHRAVIITTEAIESIDDLNGKIIALGKQGSGEHITGTVLLELLGIDATSVHMDADRALEQITNGESENGEVDAMVLLVGAAGNASSTIAKADSELLRSLTSNAGVRVLPLPADDSLSTVYNEAELGNDDIPGLIAKGSTIPTVGIPLIFVAYRWSPRDSRYQQSVRFVEALMQGRNTLQAGAHAAYWSQLDFDTEVPGITRLNVVNTVLAREEAERQEEQERDAAAKASEIATLTDALADKQADINDLLAQRITSTQTDGAAALQSLLDEMTALEQGLARQAGESGEP